VHSSLDTVCQTTTSKFVYLLKRGLAHITDPKKITVVGYCEENPNIGLSDHSVGRRYRVLFGDVDWHAGGLDSWLNSPTPPPIMLAPEDCVVQSQESSRIQEFSKVV